MVRINGFIQQDSVAAGMGSSFPLGYDIGRFRSAGDGRTFDSTTSGRESRMSIELDFEQGLGKLFVNYTCHLNENGLIGAGTYDRRCASANPIGLGNIDIATATNWSGFNEFSHNSNGDKVELRWNFVEPTSRLFGVVAPCGIVGKVSVDLSEQGSDVDLTDRVMRDFPSFEVYQYHSGQSMTLLRKPEHDLPDLCAQR